MKRLFSSLWAGWKELAGYFANFQSRWLLTVFYFTFAMPFGLIARLAIDPLNIRRPPAETGWVLREDSSEVSVPALENQF